MLLSLCASAQNTGSISRGIKTLKTTNNTSTSVYNNDEQPDTTAQTTEPEGIVYDMAVESDSLLSAMVNSFGISHRTAKIYNVSHPLISPHGIELSNAAHLIDGHYYADRGALGQCHLSLFPFSEETAGLLNILSSVKPLSLSLQPDPFPAFRRRLHQNILFQTRRPYTSLQYGSSLNKDYQIGIVHTQNIRPRWNMAFLYDLTSRDGLYTNAGGTNHFLDLSTNYYSSDARYQLQASVTYNRMRQEENGGVFDDTTWQSGSRRQGIPVNMYAAQNQWRDLELNVHQTYNTVRQFDAVHRVVRQIIDTVQNAPDTVWGYDTLRPPHPHVYNTGVFGLDIHLARHRRIFYDNQPDSWFYSLATLDTTIYLDSTAHIKASADIYWTNDAYMQHRWKNPFVILFGLRPEVNRIVYPQNTFSDFTVSPFAQAMFRLGSVRLVARAEEVTGGYRNGDYRVQGNMEVSAGRSSLFNLALMSEASEPCRFFFHSEGFYNWDLSGFNKVKRQQLAMAYTMQKSDTIGGFLRLFETRTSASLLTDNVWLNSSMVPTQGVGSSGLLLQAMLLTQMRFGWFNVRLQQMVQHSSDFDVIRVPLFASKNSLYADMHLFKGTLRMLTGFDLRYHTPYLADGWNPVLASWYRQDDMKVGGYLVADFWLTLQIKRASIYLKASHFNAPIEDLAGQTPNYFSLPHYPMEDFGLYWGVVWRFFD